MAQGSLSGPTVVPGDAYIISDGVEAAAVAAGRQAAPSVARGGGGYLAVWADERTVLSSIGTGSAGPYSGRGLGSMRDIYAARLDASGKVIDTTPIIISQAVFNQSQPQVGWNGENWLVAWLTEKEDDRYSYELRAVRVAPDGAVLDATPLLIRSANSSAGGHPVNVISDGANWVVVWENPSASLSTARAVFASRVSPGGNVLDPNGKEVYQHPSQYLSAPDLAFAGDSYLLVFIDLSAGPNFEDLVKGVRLSSNLDPVGAPFRINSYSPTKPTNPRVSSNGDSYLVVWDEHPFSGNVGGVKGSRVSHTGQVLDPNGLNIRDNVGTSPTRPGVCWDGANWFVAYDSNYNAASGAYTNQDIYVTRVSPAGAVLDRNGIPVKVAPGTQSQAAVTPGTNGGAQVVWHDADSGEDISSASVSAGGLVGAANFISHGAPRQSEPRVAAGGDGYLLVYKSEISGDTQILAQRLDARGNPVGGEPVWVASGVTNDNPSVAWNGSVFLVLWDNAGTGVRQVYGRRFTSSGTPLDWNPLLIMQGETPDVAALGETFLAVGILRSGTQLRYVQAVRVSGDGAVLGPPVTLQYNFNFAPRVAAVGERWLVVWEYHSRHDSTQSWIRGSFVGADGVAAPAFQVADGEGINGSNYDDTPHVASAGDEALVVWSDGDIKGRRVLADGTLTDSRFGFLISGAANDQLIPAVTWDGTKYIADWLDHRNEGYPSQPRGDVYGAWVSRAGSVTQQLVVANSPLPEETPFVVASNGIAIHAYSAFYDKAPYAAHRITLRSEGVTAVENSGAKSADLSVVNTASRNPALVNQILTYTVKVTNDGGPQAATNVVVTDALPAGPTFVSAASSQGSCSYSSGIVTCQIGTLAVNAQATMTIKIKPRDEGTLTNTASASATEHDPNAMNNSASVQTTVIRSADLSLRQRDSADPLLLDGQVTYTLTVTNGGPVGANDVTVTDTLPASMTFVSASASQGSITSSPPVGSTGAVSAGLGKLAVGSTATVQITVRATQAGVFTNTASVSSNESDVDTSNNTHKQQTTVVTLSKLTLSAATVTGGCQPYPTGVVFLTGPAPAGGVTINLSSTNPAASAPASVFIAAGQTKSAPFTVTTSPVTTLQAASVRATLGAKTVGRSLSVTPGACPTAAVSDSSETRWINFLAPSLAPLPFERAGKRTSG